MAYPGRMHHLQAVGAIIATWLCCAPSQAQQTARLSTSLPVATGVADGDSYYPAVSADGRFVAFQSVATNLVPNDTNNMSDIFVRDMVTNTTRLISVATDGGPANGESFSPSISADGRYVAFDSYASNLVAGDTNGYRDVFVRDTTSDTTTRVSISNSGLQANNPSYRPCISADGTHVAFTSDATNLVTGDTNNFTDVFVRDIGKGTTIRASVSSGGGQANAFSFITSYTGSLSADCRYVVFQSFANNLVAGDANGRADIFVRDTVGVTTILASVGTDGTQADDASRSACISADGNRVAFHSLATNLVAGDTNGADDIFLRDIKAATTTRVSVGTGGLQANGPSSGPSISADGRYVAFFGFAPNLTGDASQTEYVLLRDTTAGTTAIVSQAPGGVQANGHSDIPAISGNGNVVVFESTASNLVAEDTNLAWDIYARDMSGPACRLASVGSAPSHLQANGNSTAPATSSDGRFVAFQSAANNLAEGDTNRSQDTFVRDTVNGTTARASIAADGSEANGDSTEPSISADGRYVAFRSIASNLVADDTNTTWDIFIRDTIGGTTTRISIATDGTQANGDSDAPAVSAGGRYVAFVSSASNLVAGDTNNAPDIFVRDTVAKITTRVSIATDGTEANAGSDGPLAISADGRFVAFASDATSLAPGDTNGRTDVFVRDITGNTTTRISLATDGTEPDGNSNAPSMSADGRFVAFQSDATNLVTGDTNNSTDIFVRDTVKNTLIRASMAADGTEPDSNSEAPSISADGRYVAFRSWASNLAAGDANRASDIYIRDTATSTNARISVATDGTDSNSASTALSISANGHFVAFDSDATNLVTGDTNGHTDVFLRGPLGTSGIPFTATDVLSALRAAGGVFAPALTDVTRLDVQQGTSAGALDLTDAILLVRKVAGLEPNP